MVAKLTLDSIAIFYEKFFVVNQTLFPEKKWRSAPYPRRNFKYIYMPKSITYINPIYL